MPSNQVDIFQRTVESTSIPVSRSIFTNGKQLPCLYVGVSDGATISDFTNSLKSLAEVRYHQLFYKEAMT